MIDILSKTSPKYDVNKISSLLTELDTLFAPPLSIRIGLDRYVEKLDKCANMSLAFDRKEDIIGILAFYANDNQIKTGFITLLGILPSYQGLGIATQLLRECVFECERLGMNRIVVKTEIENTNAINLYKKRGFKEVERLSEMNIDKVKFCLALEKDKGIDFNY